MQAHEFEHGGTRNVDRTPRQLVALLRRTQVRQQQCEVRPFAFDLRVVAARRGDRQPLLQLLIERHLLDVILQRNARCTTRWIIRWEFADQRARRAWIDPFEVEHEPDALADLTGADLRLREATDGNAGVAGFVQPLRQPRRRDRFRSRNVGHGET